MAETFQGLARQRVYQREIFRSKLRSCGMIWRRQAGKSHTLGHIGLDWMMERPGATVIYSSASLRLGVENLRKEGETFTQLVKETRKALEDWSSETELLKDLCKKLGVRLVTTGDDKKGRILDVDALLDLFTSSKLETKLYHNRTTYSRSMVVAPNPETAVGWTGDVICDEVGRMPWFKLLMEALNPIISSNPQLRFRWSTTPSPDERHYSRELLGPKASQEFEPNANGNWYTSLAGIPVHRVDADDAYLAGVPVYDFVTGEALTPSEARKRALDKADFDRNFMVKFLAGGTSAIPLALVDNAMAAGRYQGVAVDITDELEVAA